MFRFGLGPIFLVLFAIASVSASAHQKYANKIHFLLAMDTDAENVGEGVKATHNLLLKVLSEIRKGREDKVNWTTLEGSDLNGQAVMNFYSTTRFSADTALVFLYNGHGGMEGESHFLEMAHGPMRRESLRAVMERTGTVLQVILTDCCANEAGVTPPNRRIPAEWKVFEQLFLYSQGMVDITSSQPGDFSWISPTSGGFFSQVLASKLCEKVDTLDSDDDGFVTWTEFERSLARATNSLFLKAQRASAADSEIRNYADQTPYSWYLNDIARHLEVKREIESVLDNKENQHIELLKAEIKTMSGVTKPRTRAYARSIAKAYREMADIYLDHTKSIDFHLEAVADYERMYQAKLAGDAKTLRDKGTIAKLTVLKDVLRCQAQAKNFERTGARLP